MDENYIPLSAALSVAAAWCPDDDGSVGKTGDLREMLDELEAIEPADVFTAKEKAELIKLLKIHVKPVAKLVLDENYYSLWSRIEFCLNASICADMRPEQRKEEK